MYNVNNYAAAVAAAAAKAPHSRREKRKLFCKTKNLASGARAHILSTLLAIHYPALSLFCEQVERIGPASAGREGEIAAVSFYFTPDDGIIKNNK